MSIDKRTGKEYEGPAEDLPGHEGHDSTCAACINHTMSDMVEAGIFEIYGYDGDEPLLRLTEKDQKP